MQSEALVPVYAGSSPLEFGGDPSLINRHSFFLERVLGQAIGGDDAMAVRAELDALFATRPRDEWAALFEPADCCVSPVLSTEEAAAHPQLLARQMVRHALHPTEGSYLETGPAVRFGF